MAGPGHRFEPARAGRGQGYRDAAGPPPGARLRSRASTETRPRWRPDARTLTFLTCLTYLLAGSSPVGPVNPLHPKKLLLSKWTAVQPVARDKHFLVTRVIAPEPPATRIDEVDLEALRSRAVRRIPWRELQDDTRWRQGWR